MVSRRKFSNPNTMNPLFQEFDPKVIKNVLDTRLNIARVSGDIKKALLNYKEIKEKIQNWDLE